MQEIKYFNEDQFLFDLTNQLRNQLSENYILELNKNVGMKNIDLAIYDKDLNQHFLIEMKGRPNKENLPPEIIPYINKVKETFQKENYHFILFSMSNVNSNIKDLFYENNIHLFEYQKHRNNIANDLVAYLHTLESK